MGCDIHSYAEKRVDGKWEPLGFSPFDQRRYGMFGFLAGVRNYSDVPPIAAPRGLPRDASAYVREESDNWGSDGHSHSWLSLEELSAFDYDAAVEDRRIMVGNDGGCTAKPGGGEMTTWREFLGPEFFEDLKRLKSDGAERVVFWFDN
jgi:hypothetical protein